MQLFRPRPSDDDYVETLRRSLKVWDRWRWIAAVFYIAVIALLIVMFDRIVRQVVGLMPVGNPNVVWGGFLLGTVLGMGFGSMVHSFLQQLTMAVGGFRTEQLLIAHYQPTDVDERVDEDVPVN